MTLPVVFAIAGCFALLVGLIGGGVKAKEIEVPIISTSARIASSIVGLVFIGLAIWVSSPAFAPADGQTPDATDTPSLISLKPVLSLSGIEEYEVNGKTWLRFSLNVTNWRDFSPELFLPSPNLPPCGTNENSARAWVEIYNGENDERLYGFCALSEPKDLQSLWFAVEKGAIPPNSVYVAINDRQKEILYVSNAIAIK